MLELQVSVAADDKGGGRGYGERIGGSSGELNQETNYNIFIIKVQSLVSL